MHLKRLCMLALIVCGPCASAASPRSYHLVTELRAASPERFFGPARGAYEICAAAAKVQGRTVRPFPSFAPDFVVARTVYASDGKRTFFKETEWRIDHDDDWQQRGCAMTIGSYWRSEVTDGATARSADGDDRGAYVLGEARRHAQETVNPSRLAHYTGARTVNGVQLKCDTEGNCIVDPALVLIPFGHRPAMAAYRQDDSRTMLTLEPASLTVGQPVDPALFLHSQAPRR